MPAEKPTNTWILSLLDQSLGEAIELDQEAQREEDIYFQRFTLQAPEGYTTARVGTAPADVDAAVEAIQPGDFINVTVPPARDSVEWQQRADRRGKWLRALLSHWRKGEDVLNQLLWAMLVHRLRYAFVGYDQLPPDLEVPPKMYEGESAESFIERTEMWQQQVVEHVFCTFEIKPRGAVIGVEQNGRLLYVFEHYQRTVADLHHWYPPSRFPQVKLHTRGMHPLETVTFTAFWSQHWRAAYLDGSVPIFPSEKGTPNDERGIVANQYGCLPFVQFYFRKLPVDRMARKFRGFLSPAVEMYEQESQVASQYLAIISRSAWPVVLTRFINDRNFQQIPGTSFPLRPGESVESFEGQGPIPQVGEAWDRVRFAIKQSTLGAAAGQSQPGVRAASMFSMMQAVDLNKVMPARRNLARGLAEALTIAEKILEFLHRQPVALPVVRADKDPDALSREKQTVTLAPQDIMGYYEKRVELGPHFGPDVVQRAQALSALVKDRWISRKTSWRLAPELIESAEDEDQLLVQEDTEAHPVMRMVRAMKRAQRYDPALYEQLLALGMFDPTMNMEPTGSAAMPKGGSAPNPNQPATRDPVAPSATGQAAQTGKQVGTSVQGVTPVRSMAPTNSGR